MRITDVFLVVAYTGVCALAWPLDSWRFAGVIICSCVMVDAARRWGRDIQ